MLKGLYLCRWKVHSGVRGGLGVYQDWRPDVPVTATLPELLPPQRRQILADGGEELDFA
jgi:hypothetical protein